MTLAAGCTGGPGAGTAGPTAHGGGGLPDLGLANVRTELAAARGANIGPDGGTITAAGSNGVTYTLTIPAGALLASTDIGLYPVSGVSGLPAGASLAGGAQLVPDGLRLVIPGTLEIQLPGGTDASGLIGYGWRGDGDGVGPYLAQVSGQTATLPILHFSGDAVGDPPDPPIEPLVTCATDHEMFTNVLGASSVEDYSTALKQCYEDLVGPALINATTDAAREAAADTYNLWLESIRIAQDTLDDDTFTVSPELGQSQVEAATFLRAWYDDWNDQCRADAPASQDVAISDADVAVHRWRLAFRWGVDTKANRLDLETLLDDLCVQVVIDPDRAYSAAEQGSSGTVTLRAGYRIAAAATQYDDRSLIELTVAGSGQVFDTGRTAADGRYTSAELQWPEDADPIEIDMFATLTAGGVRTDIARFDEIVKGSTGPTPPPVTLPSPAGQLLLTAGTIDRDVVGICQQFQLGVVDASGRSVFNYDVSISGPASLPDTRDRETFLAGSSPGVVSISVAERSEVNNKLTGLTGTRSILVDALVGDYTSADGMETLHVTADTDVIGGITYTLEFVGNPFDAWTMLNDGNRFLGTGNLSNTPIDVVINGDTLTGTIGGSQVSLDRVCGVTVPG